MFAMALVEGSTLPGKNESIGPGGRGGLKCSRDSQTASIPLDTAIAVGSCTGDMAIPRV